MATYNIPTFPSLPTYTPNKNLSKSNKIYNQGRIDVSGIDKSGFTDIYGNTQNALNPGYDVINQINQQATSQGPTRWASALTQQLNQQSDLARNKAIEDVASRFTSAGSKLAMRGGITSGARTMLAKQQALEGAKAQQDIEAQRLSQGLGITAEDEKAKRDLLTQLPGMYSGYAKTLADTGLSQRAQDLDIAKTNVELNYNKQKQNIENKLKIAIANQDDQRIRELQREQNVLEGKKLQQDQILQKYQSDVQASLSKYYADINAEDNAKTLAAQQQAQQALDKAPPLRPMGKR